MNSKENVVFFSPIDSNRTEEKENVFIFLEGDSGGPLMILNQTDDRWYLFGVTSHGSNSEQIKPGVYSSVSTKLDFIRQYL